jgi:hypothetical protein
MRSFQDTVDKLCEISRRRAIDPWQAVDWPERVDPEGEWFTSPELVSLHGTPRWDAMNEAQRRRLSFLEFVNFCSINVHGERTLIGGIAQRLDPLTDSGWRGGIDYLHHFLDEENRHLVWFGGFCRRYAGKVYPDRKVKFPRKYAPGEEDFLFFARTLVFEEVVDVYNQRMAKDERLAPVARRINRLHHQDETRHLAFGRQIVVELFRRVAPTWDPDTLEGVRRYLSAWVGATWREYYNPACYADAGLPDPYAVAEEAWRHPSRRAQRRDITAPLVRFLLDESILLREPSL